jgi:hypothetical protein
VSRSISRDFLLGTSVLEDMTAPLCDAVLGTIDAAASLETLAHADALVVSLDDRREWYRYDHLFRDLLLGELRRRHPELMTVYRRRAALAPSGISQMLRDGESVYAYEKKADTRWRASGARAKGVAHVLMGQPREAISELREALALLRDHPDLAHARVVCLGYLAFAAAELNDRRDVQRWAVEAAWLVAEARLDDTAGSAVAHTARALAHRHRGEYGGLRASSRTSRDSADGASSQPRGSTSISRCAVQRSASTLATLAAQLSSPRLPATRCTDTPTLERSRPGYAIWRSESGGVRSSG